MCGSSVTRGMVQMLHQRSGDLSLRTPIITIVSRHRVRLEAPVCPLLIDFEVPAGKNQPHTARCIHDRLAQRLRYLCLRIFRVHIASAIVNVGAIDPLSVKPVTDHVHAHVTSVNYLLQMHRSLSRYEVTKARAVYDLGGSPRAAQWLDDGAIMHR